MKKHFRRLMAMVAVFALGTLFINASAANTPPGKEGVLWKIEGNGIKTSYIFGTFHLISKADFDLSDKTVALLKQSENLVLELDMDEPSLQQRMMQYAQMQGEATLQNLLTEEEYNQVNSQVKETIGADLAMFNKMKPFVVTSMLLPSFFGEDVASYEGTLVQLASQNNMEVLGLETVQYQMGIFDKIPYEQQADELVEMVNDREYVVETFSEMVGYYKSGKIDDLQNLVEGYYEDREYVSILLDDRNKNWVEKIGEMSKESSTFYAVGAGHLGGKNGVITLLKKAGYKVTPVATN